MDFYAVLDQVLDLLRQRGRVTYNALKRQFELDDACLQDLKDEIIEAQRVAVDEDGRVLVWTGDVALSFAPAAVPVSVRTRPPDAGPRAYTPAHLAEKIVTARPNLEGERKQVTVLFADLKDSTELIRGLDPEAAQQLLDPAIHIMMDAVHRFEGTVNQVLGDGIMALFGAPIAHEDHALRACYAALAMQAAMRASTEDVRRTRGLELRMRVGLNSGAVVVRAIGNDLHMDYSAVGETTVLAARMEQMATPGSSRLTAATLRLVEGLVQVTALGPVPVKGLEEPVEVFELVGASRLRRRLQAAAARGLTPFVGRQQELEALHQALARAQTGHGQVVALVGEAGVGKSRLVHEVIHSHRTQGWRVLESASVSYGKATPYFPVIDLLKRYCHVDDGDDARTIRAKVTGQVLTLDETLQDTLPALLALLDAVPDDSPFLQLDPSQRRQRTLDGLRRVLLRESQVQPLLLVFEDLHWIDTETQALLDRFVESLPTASLLLLVNYRPEYQHGWGSKTYYTQLRLDPLPPASAEAFLAALLGDDPSLAPLTPLLIARTEGNPFFLEESVRTLVETGVLVGDPGAYRLAQAPPEHAGAGHGAGRAGGAHRPLATGGETPAPDRRRDWHRGALAAAAGHCGPARGGAAPRPGALQAAEFLYETRLFPEQEYTFKHALTHEVAYGSLLLERRRGLHARIVEAIEALAPGAGGRAGRTPGAPCPAGRGVGQGRDLLPAGRRQGPRPRRVPRGGGRLRAGPPGPRAPARAQRHPGAGHRAPPRFGRPAGPTGRVWAAPRPVGRGRGPGQGARRPGPAGTGTGRDGQCTQDDGRPRRRHGGGPAGPRARGRARRERLAGASIPCAWGGYTMPSATSAGRPSCCGRAWRRRTGSLARPRTDLRIQVPGVAGADLERARGLRRGPAPRGGGAPPRHAEQAEGPHRSLPTAASASCTSPKGTWSTPSGCWSRAWPSVVPPATELVAP